MALLDARRVDAAQLSWDVRILYARNTFRSPGMGKAKAQEELKQMNDVIVPGELEIRARFNEEQSQDDAKQRRSLRP